MSPTARFKSKDKRVGKEPPKTSSNSSGPANVGCSISASAYGPVLGTLHAFEPTPVTSAPHFQSNDRSCNIDETDDNGYQMSRKLEALAQQLVAMEFSSECATNALILNEGRVEESVLWLF